MLLDHPSAGPAAIRTQFGAIFVSLELSRSNWLITSLSPGTGEKMSKHSVTAGDIAGLMVRFAELHRKAAARTGKSFPMIVIQEAGFDGFWAHRVLQQEGIESHVVDPASIAVPRRGGGPKPTRSTGRRCCGRFWLIHAASRVYVRWWSPLRPRKKIGAGSAASATH